MNDAAEAMDISLRRAEQQSGFKALSAYVGVSGTAVRSTAAHDAVQLRQGRGRISLGDVSRVLDQAKQIELPSDHLMLHLLPHHYSVDGVEGIKNPVGMVGRRLEVTANVLSGSAGPMQNLMRCLDAIRISPDALVPEPLAAGRAVLDDEEREDGVLLIDLGGNTSDAGIFHGGSLIFTCSVPAGGGQISNDLAYGLGTTFSTAETLKQRYGSTLSGLNGTNQMVSIPESAGHQGFQVEQHVLAEIVDARCAETFELLREQILRRGFGDCYPAGVVLTGGACQLAGCERLAEEVLGVRARRGAPRRLLGLADAVRGPAFSASVGLLIWGSEQMAASPHDTGRLQRWSESLNAWVRNFYDASTRRTQ